MTQPTGGLSAMDLPDEEIIRYAVETLHMTEEYARFVLAMERGLIPPTGDVLTVEAEDGDAAGEGDRDLRGTLEREGAEVKMPKAAITFKKAGREQSGDAEQPDLGL